MNYILFNAEELQDDMVCLQKDPRFLHIRDVLRAKAGDRLCCGIVNQSAGSGELISITRHQAIIRYVPGIRHQPPLALRLLVAMVRPIQARRIIKATANWGAASLNWFPAELGEKSYARAGLWQTSAIQPLLIEGACQGGFFNLPQCDISQNRISAIKKSLNGAENYCRILLHADKNLPGIGSLRNAIFSGQKPQPKGIIVAVGPERGWTEQELDSFIKEGFEAYRLGGAVLRTEAAAQSALCLSSLLLGEMD